MSRGVKPFVKEVSRKTTLIDEAVEEVLRNEVKTKRRSSIDPSAIKKLSRVQELSRSIHLAIEDLLKLR